MWSFHKCVLLAYYMVDSEPDPRWAAKSGVASAPIKPPQMGQNTDVLGEGP